MGDHYRTCELHEKPFPNNLIDTTKTDMSKVYVERKEEIEGETVTLSLFIGAKNENDGIDVCASDLQEKILNLLGESPVWKIVKWNRVTKTKKDGGTYESNEKTIYSIEEYTEKIIADKKAKIASIAK